jgi:3',5'-cyclic AMP phosphodiesterase CpdA
MQRSRKWTQALRCAAALFALAFCAHANPHFYFAQISDTHFGGADHAWRTRLAADAINDLPLDIAFVALTGDITSEKLHDASVVTNAIAVLNRIEAPVHCVPGNHDILQGQYQATMPLYTNRFGGLITQHQYHGVLCLFVYTEPLAQAFSVADYAPLKELESRLKKANGQPAIVFHHSPSVGDFYNNKMHPGWKQDIRDRWIALLNQYNVKGVIAGHFHRDEHHWLGDVPLYVSSSIAGYWGRQATFRIYEYKDGRLGYRTQYLP